MAAFYPAGTIFEIKKAASSETAFPVLWHLWLKLIHHTEVDLGKIGAYLKRIGRISTIKVRFYCAVAQQAKSSFKRNMIGHKVADTRRQPKAETVSFCFAKLSFRFSGYVSYLQLPEERELRDGVK